LECETRYEKWDKILSRGEIIIIFALICASVREEGEIKTTQ
jgi:hypothetical protein